MEKNRATAIALAFISALLVMIAGKSCSDDIEKKSKTPKKQQTSHTESMTSPFAPFGDGLDSPPPEYYESQNKTEKATNGFFNPFTEAAETTEETSEIVLYDENGNPVELPPDAVFYDENGNIVVIPTEEVTTEKKSLIDEYNEKKNNTDYGKLDGFNHGNKSGESGEIDYSKYENATFPPDFSIKVN